MSLDDAMYQVGTKWYRLNWGVMLGFNVIFVGLYIAAHNIRGLDGLIGTFALSETLLVLAAASILYLVSLYWVISRFSPALATLLGTMLSSLCLLYGLWHTDAGGGYILYAVPWLTSVLFSGMYGLPLLLGTVFVTGIYALLRCDFTLASFSINALILSGAGVICAAISYFTWSRMIMTAQDDQVSRLSSMVKSNQQQAEILIQSIADGVIVVNTEGKITLMNPAAAQMSEWTVGEAVGMDAELVLTLAQEDGAEIVKDSKPFNVVLKQRQFISQTYLLTGRQGKKQVISLVISPVILPKTATFVGVVAIMRDISEERAAEKQRAEFISTASHEMRTPVAAIEGYLALALNEKVSTIDSRARGYLQKAHSSTQHLGKLFQDLLTSSKAEDGRLSNHPAVVEMGALMQQLADDLKFAAEKKGLGAEFVIGSSNEDGTIDATTKDIAATHMIKPLYYVYADPDRLREVLTNLFDNAVKYTPEGKISLGITGNTEVVQVYIRDTGAGIAPEDVPHLFQKFYRVDNSATRTIGGTGLGLFICRKIVELYHGRIWVESKQNVGSTFFINLPRLSTQRATELMATENTTVAPLPSGTS